MTHQSRTIELRNWFVDGDCDFDLNPCYVIRHRVPAHLSVGEIEISYTDTYGDDRLEAKFYNREEAEAFAKQLNEKLVPETHTYSECREPEHPFVYHTEHDGDIVFNEPTATRSSRPVVTNEQCADFTRT